MDRDQGAISMIAITIVALFVVLFIALRFDGIAEAENKDSNIETRVEQYIKPPTRFMIEDEAGAASKTWHPRRGVHRHKRKKPQQPH
jgi:hypothetical protein